MVFFAFFVVTRCDQIGFNRLRNNVKWHAGIARQSHSANSYQEQIIHWIIERNDLTNPEKLYMVEKLLKNRRRTKKAIQKRDKPKTNQRLQSYLRNARQMRHIKSAWKGEHF